MGVLDDVSEFVAERDCDGATVTEEDAETEAPADKDALAEDVMDALLDGVTDGVAVDDGAAQRVPGAYGLPEHYIEFVLGPWRTIWRMRQLNMHSRYDRAKLTSICIVRK